MIGSKKKTKKGNVLKEIADNFEQLTSNPERFLKPQPEQIEAIEQLIQQTYSVSISGDVANKKDLLQELVLEQMDEEQIWQQLEMRNELVFQQLLEQTAQMTAIREQHLGIELDEGEEEEEDPEAEAENGELDAEESDEDAVSDASFEEDLPAKKKSQPQKEKGGKRMRNSIVDDTFFKLQEMNEFLEQEDAKEMRRMNNKRGGEQAEEIDHFAEDFGLGEDEEDDDGNVNYADFFEMDEELERKSQKLNKGKTKDFFNEDESDKEEKEDDEDEDNQEDLEEAEGSEEEPDPEENLEEAASEIDESEFVSKSGIEPASGSDSDSDKEGSEEEEYNHKVADPPSQSSNELREARLFQRIRDYEDVVLGEKPWQLKGEVQAANRPQNSLLEEILDFDSTTRPTAPITEEDNRSIEDIIKQRIRDKAWDDVVRTVRPVNTPQEYRKQLILDQEKSKQSLSQIYEAQYQRELDKLDPNRDADDNSGPEPKEHQEIKKAMRSLFLKLDALSNFHFTPKPVAPEARIVTNTPVVHMEEVAPVAVSDANLLAPEEVFQGPKHAPLGKSERSRTDKNRERRKKKQKQRAIHSALEQRDLQRAKEGKAPTKKEADAKLLKTITKSRNVQKITASSNDQGALKSSKAFFNKLQDTTAATASNKRPKKDVTKANAKKLKL